MFYTDFYNLYSNAKKLDMKQMTKKAFMLTKQAMIVLYLSSTYLVN